MKSIQYIVLVTVLITSCVGVKGQQQKNEINKHIKDANGNEMLVGKCSADDLKRAPFSSWFLPGYSSYQVDSTTCDQLNSLLADKTITIFMGTWCGDSKREVPRILKILDHCNFDKSRINMVMVGNAGDSYKKSPGHEEEGRNIVRVPTIIIEKNGKESGRIIEYPVESLEKDMLAILQKKDYTPNCSETSKTGK